MDYLDEAKHIINEVQSANLEPEEIQADAQLATACALVAQAELLAALIGRLDALNESKPAPQDGPGLFDGGRDDWVSAVTQKV